MDLIRAAQPTPAKDFTVPALTSASTGLSDFAGKAILLNFWATWCPPCKEEMPSMERLYRRYKDRGFTVVAVSNDATGAAAVAPFAHALRLTFPIGLDADMTVTNEYNVRGLPSTYLIDREGNVVALAIGSRKWDSAAARAVIESLLGTSADR